MSGTSADGVDAALVEIAPGDAKPPIRLLAYETVPYPSGLRERILAVASGGSTEDVCHLNAYLGELFAEAAVQVARKAGVPLADVSLIGSHGQTIHHLPAPRQEGPRAVRSTLQIGEAAVIAERTGVTTIADFRPRDVAAGGEGAPLTPIVHYAFFSHPERGRVILNLGGIANLTVLPAGSDPASVTGFDTGPGNVLLDEFVRLTGLTSLGYDEDGRLAARGQVQPNLLEALLQHPFVRRPPPKSTGREVFGPAFVVEFRGRLDVARASPLDGLATLTAFTVEAVARNLREFVLPKVEVHEVVVTGGGARNAFLMRRLADAVPRCAVAPVDALGVPARALEAMAFAWLAYLTATGRPGNLPVVTGARGPRILGCIVPGRGFRGLREEQ
ncbi:MAG TPA: anhydro-N-acetylmuramic acid kinase [Candidatus Methylomirabilis sp.]|nr:anhydro-N-acetylmuramic acid kinase [Candidatus Methylomirabilis sp.]